MVKNVIKSRGPYGPGEIMNVASVGDNGEALSTGSFILTDSSFCEGRVKTLLVCGLSTPVENRRRGNIRSMISEMHELAAEEGAAVSLLHPFSFSYYRRFGYERVSDHLIAEFRTSDIDFVPQRCRFVPYEESTLDDMIAVYDAFSRGRNLLLPRYDGSRYTGDGKRAYIYYEDGAPAAYVVVSGEKNLRVNNYTNTRLNVHELAYVSPAALSEIFSFLRMFDGEYERIRIFDCSLCREVDMMLRHYTRTEYRTVADIAARVINTEKLLSSASYPEKEGSFTVRVTDGLKSADGVFRVVYGGGDCKVSSVGDVCAADLTLTAGAFTQIVYGYRPVDQRSAAYMDGVCIHGDCDDFFCAFPCRPCGAFEHF